MPGDIERQRKLVIVGNGMVGQRLVDVLRDRDIDRTWQVSVLGEESRRAYDRVALSSYFDGVDASELDVVPPGCYEDDDYVLNLGERVVSIDRAAKTVRTDA